jgi:DNA topoisomerase I
MSWSVSPDAGRRPASGPTFNVEIDLGGSDFAGRGVVSSPQPATRLPKPWLRLVVGRQQAENLRRRIRSRGGNAPPLDGAASADIAGLRYVDDTTIPGIKRVGPKRYVDAKGRVVSNREVLHRIASLVIPPAWRDVWICPHPLGHLQATGRDARGRKQYRYHPRWREMRDDVKYGRLIAFAETLPRIRQHTAADLDRTGLPREKVLAAVVQLLEKTLIRIGNDEYARQNQSFGLTTMRDKHAKISGASVRFEFRGKSGIAHCVDLHDARLARIVKKCRDLPGHELFQYIDDGGRRQTIGSADVNAYLREITGEAFTAKDFRTWAGTVLAARELSAMDKCDSEREAKRQIVRAVESVAKQLGNTKTVCRKSYIHPAVLDAYSNGQLVIARRARPRRAQAGLAPIELAVVEMLRPKLRPAKRAAV